MSTPLRLTIPEPCHENWQQMTPNEQGRHCLSCQKTVVDFTLMSDQEVLQYISTASSSVCGRFNNDQLNKTYQERKIKPSFTVRYAWHILVSAFLWVGQSVAAQTNSVTQGDVDYMKIEKPKTEKPKKKRARKIKMEYKFADFAKFFEGSNNMEKVEGFQTVGFTVIHDDGIPWRQPVSFSPLKTFGLVLNEKTGKPLDSVSVRILGSKVDLPVDKEGNFEFVFTGEGATVTLEIDAKGFEKRVMDIPAYSVRRVEILIKPAETHESGAESKELAANGPVTEELGMVGMVVPVIVKGEPVLRKEVTEPTLGTPVIWKEDEKEKSVAVATPATEIRGLIKDDQTQFPVGFATVRVKGSELSVAADEQGQFEWPSVKNGQELVLVISAVGYETREVTITKESKGLQEITLTPEADELKAVEVRGYSGRKVCTDMVGSVVMVTKVPLKEQVLRSVKDTLQSWLPMKREITVYPNPAVKGNQVNLRLDLPKTGTYRLELLDASGRIVHAQQIQVAQPSQVASIPTQSIWSAGIYWLRLSNAADKKIYQTKVMLQ